MGRDESHKDELTDEIKANADRLVTQVNAFLQELGWEGDISVSSGWRPPSVNATVKGAAKKSLHQTGLAVDIVDKDGELKEIVKKKPELLEKYELWMEDGSAAPTWCHLDLGKRSARAVRIFFP